MAPSVRIFLAVLALSAGILAAVLLALWLYRAPAPPRVAGLREIDSVIAEAIHITREAAQ